MNVGDYVRFVHDLECTKATEALQVSVLVAKGTVGKVIYILPDYKNAVVHVHGQEVMVNVTDIKDAANGN